MASADLLEPRTPAPPRRRCARRWPATSVAAPATTTSSRRCSTPPRRGCRHEHRRAGHSADRQVGRPGDAPQGGPADDHGSRPLRRRHRARRACSTWRSCARPRRTRRSSRSTPRARSRRRASTASSPADDVKLESPLPMAWVPPGVEIKSAETLAARQGRGEVRRPGRGDRARHRQVRRPRRRRAALRRVRPAARGRRPGEGARGRLAARARGHGGPTRRTSGRSAAATWTPPGPSPRSSSSGGSSTTARRARRSSRALRRRPPRRQPHAAPDEPEPAPDPALHGRRARHVRGPHPRDRARRRRRLRRQDRALRRGGPRRLGLAQAQPPGQVDGDALRAHELDDPRPRPDRLREGRRQARRHDRRARVHGDLRPRRLLLAADAVHPVLHGLRDQRLLQDPEPQVHGPRRLHQQDGDRRHARRRPPGGDPPDRGDGRAARGRARDGLARAAAQELHPEGGLPGRGGDRASSTTPATTTARSTSCSRTSTSTAVRREAEGLRAKGIYRGIGFSHLDGDLRPGAVARRRPERRRPAGRLLRVVDRAHPRLRLGHRLQRHRAARPGPRHVVRADRRRPRGGYARPGRRHARRHRDRPVRPRHLRLALAGRGRRVARPLGAQGGGQGQGDRRAPARGGARGHRARPTASTRSRARPTRA